MEITSAGTDGCTFCPRAGPLLHGTAAAAISLGLNVIRECSQSISVTKSCYAGCNFPFPTLTLC